MNFCFLLSITLSMLCFRFSGAYDSLDPNGEVTIKWDFNELRPDGYTAMVTITNNQLYRHIELPGWKYGWTWGGDEVIWSITGAEATEQGNCTRYTGTNIPHCCEKSPVIVDLLAGTPYNKQVQNCCRGGVLTSITQDSSKHVAAFQMSVGSTLNVNDSSTPMPYNFSFGVPGYTCSNASVVPSTRFLSPDGRRWTQTLLTWKISCSFSQFRASPRPSCCVSLSTFYNDTIVPCPTCSCACQDTSHCPSADQVPSSLQTFSDYEGTNPFITCTQHMCPTKIHWHVKTSYKGYWRVKVTISNYNMVKNYSDWNLVIQHPNLRSIITVFSFNYKSINPYGHINDTGMFWGVKYYNDVLLQAGEFGNVQSEFLLHKDAGMFTFEGGWAFPRSILFNGYECVMPPADDFPSLPPGTSASTTMKQRHSTLLAIFVMVNMVWWLL